MATDKQSAIPDDFDLNKAQNAEDLRNVDQQHRANDQSSSQSDRDLILNLPPVIFRSSPDPENEYLASESRATVYLENKPDERSTADRDWDLADESNEPSATDSKKAFAVTDPPAHSLKSPGANEAGKNNRSTSEQVRVREESGQDSPMPEVSGKTAKTNRGSTQKVGIIGGKGAGKSYLFQAMVYRTCTQGRSGALTYYLDRGGVRLNSSHVNVPDAEKEEEVARFVNEYCAWNRLSTTLYDDQRWYRLRLPYRSGWLGFGRRELEVDFFDGSGEYFLELDFEMIDEAHHRLWKNAYLNVTTMVFCLPLWAVFPDDGLAEADRKERKVRLDGFRKVVANFRRLRDQYQIGHPVRCILALTMADDSRCALANVREHWIIPYMHAPEHYLERLRKGRGVARYLANTRKVSEALYREFDRHPDPLISGIPEKLEFNGGRPWLIPVSAINGDKLDSKERHDATPDRPPVPVHVELPLLVALCERENALM